MRLCKCEKSVFFCLFISAFILSSSLYSETDQKNNLGNGKLAEAEKLLADAKTRQKAMSSLESLAKKSKDNNEKYESKALLSQIFRNEKKFDKAIDVVSDCTDFDKIGKQSLSQFKSTYLMAFLEAAHCKALDKDKPAVRESFKMLDYAENSTNGIDKARSQYKYGAVLFDINEFGKADTYLKKAIETADAYLKGKIEKDSAGENKPIPEMNDWRKLKTQIDELLFLVSIELLREEYGEGYALYVKMRSYYDKGDFYWAFHVAKKLMKDFSEEAYGEAGRFYWCRMLVGNDFSGDMKDKTLPDGMKELHKFIKDNPHGLYRGEAWMELGRVELEKNWDTGKSSEYYKKALEWFRTIRERKDLAELYAVPEKVTRVAAPQKPLSSFDEWSRIIYRNPSPKEIINIRTAPWYADEMEKECLFMVGFFLLMENQPDKAKECFLQVKVVSKGLAALDSKGVPNALWRLESACNVGFMVFPPEEKKYLKGINKLMCSYAELNYLLEKFDAAKGFFIQILNEPRSDNYEKAIASIGIAISQDLGRESFDHLKNACSLSKNSPIAGNATYRLGCFHQADSKTSQKSVEFFNEYIRHFPGGSYENKVLYRLSFEYIRNGKMHEAGKLIEKLKGKSPESNCVKYLEKMLSERNRT